MNRTRRNTDEEQILKHHRSSLSSSDGASPRRRSNRVFLNGRLRMVAILLGGCTVFFTLYSLLGHIYSRPTFENRDEFPRRIWQSWKVDPLRFADRDIERARTWTVKNPGYRYEVLTDDNAVPYVDLHFGPNGFNRPDIVATYKAMSSPNTRIIQADLLRYILLYVEGGLWADIDVEALRPIDQFIPGGVHERDIDMIIGIETDEPSFIDHPFLGAKAQSFCQWTFICKPRLPVMLQLIENILVWLNDLSREQGVPIAQLELDFDTVLLGTGPSAFTVALLAEMSRTTGDSVTWDQFHGLDESKVVGGVLVLPSEAFAAGTGHSNSGNHGGRRALVKHHFHASSWTTHHQRYKHPIYEEVEKCNWDIECVKLWDANVAFYASLPEDEQLRMIEMKRLDQIPINMPESDIEHDEEPVELTDEEKKEIEEKDKKAVEEEKQKLDANGEKEADKVKDKAQQEAEAAKAEDEKKAEADRLAEEAKKADDAKKDAKKDDKGKR